MNMIEINNLTKYYGENIGIKNLSFNVKKGELFGFVGPNGAGKSTTIRTLLGFIFPNDGNSSINKFDTIKDSQKIKEFTGYVPSDVRMYNNLVISDLLSINGKFYKDNNYYKEVKRLVKLLELDVSKRFNELSMGNKKKVSIIIALAQKPSVLILDEPTNGLDPLIQRKLFKELKNRTAKGTTVLLSSHNLSEIEEYSDRVAFINKGELVSIVDLKRIEKYKIITLMGGNLDLVKEEIIKKDKDRITFKYNGCTKELLKLLNKISPNDMVIENEKLEDYFLNMYKGDI